MAARESQLDLLLEKLEELDPKLDGLRADLQRFIVEEVDRRVSDRDHGQENNDIV